MTCAVLSLIAHSLTALQLYQHAYDGITSVTFQLLILVPAVPVGTVTGILGLALSDSGSASSIRSGWALTLLWIAPIVLFAALAIMASIAEPLGAANGG